MLCLSPYRPFNGLTDDYCSQLHGLNENVSLILRLKKSYFEEHWALSNCQRSWVWCIVSVLHYLPHRKECSSGALPLEDWQEEYMVLLEGELWGRVLRLAGRILELDAAPLLRTIDLVFLTRLVRCVLQVTYLDPSVLFKFVLLAFRVGTLMRKSFAKFIQSPPLIRAVDESDIYTWCFLSAAAQLDDKEMAVSTVVDCLLGISGLRDLSVASDCLRYISWLPLWRGPSVPFAEIAERVSAGLEDGCILADLIASIKSPQFGQLAHELGEALERSRKVRLIVETLPALSLKDAQVELTRCEGNASLAISKLGKPRDATRTLLDDKSFVRENLEKIILVRDDDDDAPDCRVYDDEYVDTFDQASPIPDARGKQAEGIKGHKNADSITGVDADLLRAYMKDPQAFARGSMVRQSKARQSLCNSLKLSHEQIEGWALMFARNPRKDAVMQDFLLLHPPPR